MIDCSNCPHMDELTGDRKADLADVCCPCYLGQLKDKEADVEKSGFVTVTKKDYLETMERLAWLDSLVAAGVDNWGGIDDAYEIFEETK